MTQTLRIEDLGVTIGDHRLLEGITLAIETGRIVCVVGPNGAGKTTLLDAICGLVPADGTIVVGANGSIGRAFQGSPLPATLTVAECALVVTGARDAAETLMERFGLRPHASLFVSELSTGMRRILDLAVATAHDPALLILDEPSSGLALAEVRHLGSLIRGWRDRTGAGVLVVEHDAALVRAIADEVVVLSEGRLQAHGRASEVLDARRAGRLRLRHPKDPEFVDAIATVAAEAAPAAPLPRRTLSTWTVLRLGLRQFAAGVASMLILGVLNRVMKIELGISLDVAAPILASLNLAAPLALGVGHRSDTKPIFGYRRAPYIIGGALITAAAVAAAPHLAARLSAGVSAGIVLGALGVFTVMGIGMYGAGTVFFALIADKTPEEERAHVSSVVYLMLIAGIFAGVGMTGGILERDAGNLGTLFAIAAGLIVALTVIAVWGQEERVTGDAVASGPQVTFARALRDVSSLPMARRFFWFMIVSTVFLFLQQAILEPYGGEVLGMDPRQTSAFNAMMAAGILLGIWSAGRPWAGQVGHMAVARYGLIGSAASFGLLAWAAAAASEPASWTVLFVVGASNGLFTVAGLAMMMAMASRRYAALFMGAWTVAHALAEGIATASGGVFYERLVDWFGNSASAYATVFGLQAFGLALCVPLLARIDLRRFREESDALDASA